MSSIQTGIALQDNFTSVMYDITNATYEAFYAVGDMQQVMNANVDPSGFEAVTDEVNQTAAAVEELNAALQETQTSVAAPTVDTGTQAVINADVNPILPDPLIENPPPIETPIQPNAPPDPVEIPIQWETDGLDVFTSTGIDRFRQEVQSTNSMLEQLSSTQDSIARQAYNTMIFPPEAFQNLNSLAVRIDMVRDRIQQIENNPVNIGTDTANAELEQLRSQLNQALQAQNNLNSAMDNMDVSAANDAYLRLSQTVSSAERYIRDNVDEQGRFNQEIQEGTNQANSLTNAVKGAVAAYISIQSVGGALNISDEMTQTVARLNLMNDNLQTTPELFNMIYASAKNTHAPFLETADAIAKMGNNAGAAFNSNQELIAFMEQVNKQFVIGGAAAQEQSSAMLQLSQAMAAGALRGDELNSILEAAPEIARAIETNMGWAEGSIKSYAEDGAVTAEVVKNSLLNMADETNAAFESMPLTFSQAMTDIQTDAIMAFQPVLQRLNDIANSKAFQNFVNGAIEAMAVLANIVLNIFDLIGTVGGFIADNWSIISPIIYGVIGALAIYAAYLAIVKGAELASAAAKGVMAVASGIQAAAYMILTGSTWAAATAQYGLNGAMYACPIVWIIILIIALIAIIIALCNWIARATGAANSGIGIIVGALAVAAAFIGNLFVTLINLIIDIIGIVWNHIANFAEFFANVFNDPVGSIVRLFVGMADTVLGILEGIASAIDTLFGSNLADAVSGWRSSLEGAVTDLVGEAEIKVPRMDTSSMKLDRFEYGDAWDAGVAVGDGISTAIDNLSLSDLLGSTDMPNPADYSSQLGGVAGNLDTIADDTGGIKDAMDITEEDLKYLRDIAEQEAVNRYTVAEISIDQSGMQNTIKNGDDLDGFMSGLTDSVNEAIDSITEGVHE